MAATSASKEEFWALKDVSFDIEQGDRVGIIGRNGAGKSTLLKILSRITEPTTGSIKIKGRVASLLEVGTGFHPELTGRENIYLNGAILGMSRAEIKKHFDAIVDFAETEKFLDTPVKRYSSGMYVRLAFAVAAHLEPEILVIDEVLAVGDAQFQKKCLGKMEDVSRNEGRTVLFVSHNIGAIKTLCNKGIVLNSGKVEFQGLVQESIISYTKKIVEQSHEYIHIKGSGEIIVNKLKFNSGNKLSIFEFLKISISISIINNVDEIEFFIILHNHEGEPLMIYFQTDCEKLFKIPYDVKELIVNFETINNLLPGIYYLSAGIFDKNKNFIDWVEMAEEFEVLSYFDSGKPFDNRIGKVTSIAKWEIV